MGLRDKEAYLHV